MSLFLQRSLSGLRDRLLNLCATVEGRVQMAVRALETQDMALARRVIEGDSGVDLAETKLEEECLKVLALYQPVAIDLRLVVTFLKINNDIERIADLAVHIAERALNCASHPPVEPPFPWHGYCEKTQAMLRRSLDAVDALHRRMYDWALETIQRDPIDAPALLDALAVSRYLERIADHATNIAEDTIYLFTGEIVRHRDSLERGERNTPAPPDT